MKVSTRQTEHEWKCSYSLPETLPVLTFLVTSMEKIINPQVKSKASQAVLWAGVSVVRGMEGLGCFLSSENLETPPNS